MLLRVLHRDLHALLLQWLDRPTLGAAAQACRAFAAALPPTQRLWRREAAARFGQESVEAVEAAAAAEAGEGEGEGEGESEGEGEGAAVDWAAFCHRRSCHAQPPEWPSPLHLVQEDFMRKSPFQVLACCILTSRTSGGQAVHDAIHRVIGLLPTPAAVLGADAELLLEVTAAMRPLGMQVQRMRALSRMAQGYARTDWKDPMELYGIGPFGAESYRLMTGNPTPLHAAKYGRGTVTDRSVLAYSRWLRRASGEPDERPPAQKKRRAPRKARPQVKARPRPPTAPARSGVAARTRSAKRLLEGADAAPAAAKRRRTRSSFLG